MRVNLIKAGLAALAISLTASGSMAFGEEMGSMYFTPKILYSYQEGEMAPAQAINGNGWKTEALGGDENDQGYAVGFSLGNDLSYYYEMPVRVELEYMYRSESKWKEGPRWVGTYLATQDFTVTAQSLMFNAFYDFNTQTNLTPYFGGGLGVSYLSTDYQTTAGSKTYTNSNSDINFAWNIGGGVVFHISDSMALDFGYRYVDLGTATAGDLTMGSYVVDSQAEYTSHEFGLGIRFSGF